MKSKMKSGSLKIAIFALSLLLCFALSIGISSAFYQAKRQASGTVIMNQGIIIDYQGFSGNATPQKWEKGVNVLLFETTDAQPGQNIAVNAASIKANVESVDFYARLKLNYEFYNGETKLETLPASFKVSDLITTSTSFFGDSWVESSADGYFYYGSGSTLHKFDQSTDFVALFADGAKFIIEGENFVGADNEGQGGGFKIDETTSINKIVVTLTLETLQGSADAAAEGWTLTPITRVDLEKLADVDGITGATIDDLIPDDETRDNQVVLVGDPTQQITITISSRAFAGCPNLNLALSDSANIIYQIASDAFENSTGATIMYGLNNVSTALINPNVSGKEVGIENKWKVSDPNLHLFLPTAIQSVSTEYGDYQYTDNQGTWYFDLIDESGNRVAPTTSTMSASTLASTLASSNLTAKIKHVNNNSTLTTLTIPSRVGTSAGSEMFDVTVLERNGYNYNYNSIIRNHTNIQTVVIPNSVISIGGLAFSSCSGLTSITIPNSVTNIGSCAFRGCSRLTSITIPDSVESIGSSAFYDCYGLTSITIPDSVTSIGDEAFRLCRGLTGTLIIPNSLTSIGEQAFDGCSGLTGTLTIPSSVTSIGKQAFSYCSGLETITVESGNTKYYSAGNCIIETASKTLIAGCNNSVIPNDGSVTSIGEGAFKGCYGLTGPLTIPDGVTSIGKYAFENCTELTSVTIPDSVESIGSSVFGYCTKLTTINIGAGVTEVSWLPSSVTSVTISSNNENFASDGKAIFVKKSGNVLEASKYVSSETSYTIPSKLTLNGVDWNVTSIGGNGGDSRFSGRLESIIIPDSVESIGSYAFKYCGLKSVAMGSGIKYIGYGAFFDCNKLELIPNLEKVLIIEDDAFNNCEKLESIINLNSVTSIGYRAFSGCSRLTSVTIGNKVESIGSSAFSACTSLQTVVLPEGITSVPPGCFSGCTNLTTVTIPSTATSIGDFAFENCSKLTTVIWNVTYNLDGVTATAQQKVQLNGTTTNGLTIGGKLQAAPTNLESGLTFEGWTDGTETYPAGSTYTFTMTNRALKAVYNKYVITFDANGGEGSAEKQFVEKGNSMTLPSVTDFTKEGYKAIGWSESPTATSGYAAGASYTPTANTKFYIIWVEKDPVTITFDLNGGNGTGLNSIIAYEGKLITLPTAAELAEAGVTKTGYKAIGFGYSSTETYVSYNFGSSYTVYSSDVTLYVVWEQKNEVTLTINVNDGEGTLDPIVVERGTTITLPTLEELTAAGVKKTDCKAIGFGDSSTQTYVSYNFGSSYTVYSSDVTLYVVWAQKVSLTIDLNGADEGTTPEVQYGYYGDTITLPTAEEIAALGIKREGYIMTNFSIDKQDAYHHRYSFGAKYKFSSSNVTMYIIWKKLVTISFDVSEAASVGIQDLVAPEPINTYESDNPSLPTVDGAETDGCKVGWSTDPNFGLVTANFGDEFEVYGNENFTLYLTYQKKYTITFDANGATSGEVPEPIKAYWWDDITIPSEVTLTKEGYKFLGWNVFPDCTNVVYNPKYYSCPSLDYNQDITLYAVWGSSTDIKFNLNGGRNATSNQNAFASIKDISYGQTFTIPSEVPTRDGYTFNGWLVFSSWYSTSSSVEIFDLWRLGQEITSQFIGGENCELVAYWVKNEPTSCPERDINQYIDDYYNFKRGKYLKFESGTILSLTKAELNYFGYLQYIGCISEDAFKSYTEIGYTLYNSNNEIIQSIDQYELMESINLGETYTIKFTSADAKIVLKSCSVDYIYYFDILTSEYNAETETWDITITIDPSMEVENFWISVPGEMDIDDCFPEYDATIDYTCWALFGF